MPASGTKEVMSEAELEQRSDAGQRSRIHGTYAIRDRGQEAMTPVQRSKYAELQEQLLTRQGTEDAMRDAAVNTLMLAGVAQSFCIEQHQKGIPLDRIELLSKLPMFWNSANRALKTYLDTLPKERDILDLATVVTQAMNEGEDNGHS